MLFTPEHEQFRQSVRQLVEQEINPNIDEWEAAEIFPAHELFPKIGAMGGFGLEYDPEYGGGGADHSYTVVLAEELGRCDAGGVPMPSPCRRAWPRRRWRASAATSSSASG